MKCMDVERKTPNLPPILFLRPSHNDALTREGFEMTDTDSPDFFFINSMTLNKIFDMNIIGRILNTGQKRNSKSGEPVSLTVALCILSHASTVRLPIIYFTSSLYIHGQKCNQNYWHHCLIYKGTF